MSKKVLSDAGVGRAMFATRLRLSLQAGVMCLFYGLVPGLLLPFIGWYSLASNFDVSIVRLHVLAHVLPDRAVIRWRVLEDDGKYRVLMVQTAGRQMYQWMHPPAVRQIIATRYAAPVDTFGTVALLSLLSGAFGYGLVWYGLRRIGAGAQDNTRIRGASAIVSSAQLHQLVLADDPSPYKHIDVALPKSSLTTGIIALGSQDSGKSFAINDLLLQVFARTQPQMHQLRPEQRVFQGAFPTRQGCLLQPPPGRLGALVDLLGVELHV